MPIRRRDRPAAPAAPPALLAAAAVVAVLTTAPLWQLLVQALTPDPAAAAAVLLRPRTLDLLVGSLALTSAVCAGALVLGVATAVALVRLQLPLPRLWPVLACLPLAVPSYVAAFAWRSVLPGVDGLAPLVLVMVLTTAPYVTIPTAAALAQADHTLADVARTLGRGRLSALATTTAPQVLPSALAGTLLVALYTLSDFGAPAILRYETLTTGVYRLFSGGLDRSAPAALALLLAVLALACVGGERWLRGRSSRGQRSAASRAAPARALAPVATLAVVTALGAVAVVSVVLPLLALVAQSLTSQRYGVTAAELVTATASTLLLAATAATAAALLALPVAHLAARHDGRLVSLLESASYTGHALPGVVVALALVALWVTLAPGAYQSATALVACYVVLFLPRALGGTRAAVVQVSPRTEDASRSLGSGPLRTWRRVVLPQVLPAVVGGWLLVMTAVIKELPATLLLRPTGLDTLTTEMWSRTVIGAYGAAAPLGVMLVVVGLVPAWVLSRSITRHRGSVL